MNDYIDPQADEYAYNRGCYEPLGGHDDDKRKREPMEFVTADPHFFHRNIIQYCNRPVDSVTQMNQLISDVMTAHCYQEDTLYVLGDIYFGGKAKGEDAAELLNACQATKILIVGNHDNLDSWPQSLIDCFSQVLDAKIVRRYGIEVIMTHRPLLVDEYWKGDYVNLHGHVHGIIPNPPGRLDVGVDPAWVYFGMPRPFTMEEAIRMALETHAATHIPNGSNP